MEENIKSRIILILVILVVIFFIGTIGSCSNSKRIESARLQEMYAKLDFAEKVTKVTQEKRVIEEKLKKANQELETERTAQELLKKALLQEQLVNQSLKEELQKVTKLKETLEEDLKEALVAGKKKAKK